METLIARRLARQAAVDVQECESDAEIFIRQVSISSTTAPDEVDCSPRTQAAKKRRRLLKLPSISTKNFSVGAGTSHSDDTTSGEGTILHSKHGKELESRLTHLAASFRARSQQAKQIISKAPPHDSPSNLLDTPEVPTKEQVLHSPMYDYSGVRAPITEENIDTTNISTSLPVVIIFGSLHLQVPEWFFKIPRPPSVDPHSKVHLAWLAIMSLAFLYNAIVIPYRASFPVHPDDHTSIWLVIDYFCDFIYITDLVIWKAAIKTQVHGIVESNKREIFRSYVTTTDFRLDLFSLTPLDFFYLIPAVKFNTLLRLPRLLQLYCYWEFMDRIDQLSINPYYFRVLRTLSNMFYIIHANACIYYYFSYLKGFDPDNRFIYNNAHEKCFNNTNISAIGCNFPGVYSAYMFCFFFSVSMITIIGNVNIPGYVSEIIYSTILWFIGVFVFATLIGQIRDVLRAKTRQEDEFYETLDAIMDHLHTLNTPSELRLQVKSWLLHNWEQQGTTNESRLLDGQPSKLRTDMAMEVHYSTIHKVQLFRHMEKKVVEELLLRLQPTVYLPGDYICRIDEIGKEMFIVKSGLLEVILPDGRLAVTLGPGSVFGEISLLALAGGNRRTANVRSKGFSNLYVLTKGSLNEVMKDYPEQMEALKAKAQEHLNKGKVTPQESPTEPKPVEVIHSRPPTPTLVRVALSVLKADSPMRRRLDNPKFKFTQPETRDTESSDTSSMDRPVYVELLTEKGYPRKPKLKPVTPSGLDISLDTTEEIEMQDLRDPVCAFSSQNEPISQQQPRRQKRSRSRNRSSSAQSSASPDANSSDSDVEPASSRRLRPGHSARRYPGRTPPLTPKDLEESNQSARNSTGSVPTTASKPHAPALSEEVRSFSSKAFFNSPNLRHLRQRFFRPPKITPLRSEASMHRILSERSKSGVFDFGPDTADKIGDNPPPLVLTSDMDDYRLSDNNDSITFSSFDSS